MSTTSNHSPDMVGVVTQRLTELYYRVYGHLRRQPQHVADVKAGKRPATFLKHRRDYWAMYQRGGDLKAILDGIDELRADVATWAGCDLIGAVEREHLTETEKQGPADVLVLVAARTDSIPDLERAYDAQSAHTHASTRLVRSLGKRLAQRRGEHHAAAARFGFTPSGRAS